MSARWLAIAVAASGLLATATAAAQEDPVRDDPYPRPAHFMLRADGGPTYRSLYGIDVGAGSVSVGASAETRAGSFGGSVFGVFGETEAGLGLSHWGAAGEAAWFVGDRVRLGVGPRFGWLELDRFTPSSPAEAFTVGLVGRASVDLVRNEGFALALGIEPAVDTTVEILSYGDGSGGGLTLPSVGAFLQVRYRFARAPLAPVTTPGSTLPPAASPRTTPPPAAPADTPPPAASPRTTLPPAALPPQEAPPLLAPAPQEASPTSASEASPTSPVETPPPAPATP